jgi:hypothetical protein
VYSIVFGHTSGRLFIRHWPLTRFTQMTMPKYTEYSQTIKFKISKIQSKYHNVTSLLLVETVSITIKILFKIEEHFLSKRIMDKMKSK